MGYVGYLKNIVILLLVVLSIYQTDKLWDMGGASGLNFVSVNQPIPSEDLSKQIAMPTMIYRYNSYKDNFTGIFYNEYEKNYCVEYSYNVLKKDGVKIESRYLKESDLANCIIVFEYENQIDYKSVLDIIFNESIDNNANFVFDMVYIIKEDDVYYVNFVDKSTNMLNKYIIKNKELLPTAVLKEIVVGTSYVNTMERYNTQINDFIIDIDNNAIDGLNKVNVVNPYYNENELLLSDIQNKTKSFFGNTSNTWSRIDKDSFVFSSDDIIIKYFSNNVLEVSYYNGGAGGKTSLDKSYGIARAFIDNDLFIKNKIFLQDYEVEEDKYTFYFDYYIDSIPIVVPNSANLESHIKITVENNSVTSYKKLVYNYEKAIDDTIYIYNFDKKVLEDYFSIDNLSPMGIRLVYTARESNIGDNTTKLEWEVENYDELDYIDILINN